MRGFEPPTWRAVVDGLRPDPREPEGELGSETGLAASSIFVCRDPASGGSRLRPCQVRDAAKALMSQEGSGTGLSLSASPTPRLRRFESQQFRILFLRRFRLPLPDRAFFPNSRPSQVGALSQLRFTPSLVVRQSTIFKCEVDTVTKSCNFQL